MHKKFHVILSVFFLICSTCIAIHPFDRFIEETLNTYDKELKEEGWIQNFWNVEFDGTDIQVRKSYSTTRERLSSIDEARYFFILKADQLLRPFNCMIRNDMHLHNFSVNSKNALFSFTFLDKSEKPLLPPYISLITNSQGIVFYYHWDESKNENRIIHSETFADAYMKFRAQVPPDKKENT